MLSAMTQEIEIEDEQATSPIDGAAIELALAKRSYDDAAAACQARRQAQDAAEQALRVAFTSLAASAGWDNGSFMGGRSRTVAVPYKMTLATAAKALTDMAFMTRDAAAELEASAAGYADARALRRIERAAKSLRYHAERAKEGK